jgi:hypothetical protein
MVLPAMLRGHFGSTVGLKIAGSKNEARRLYRQAEINTRKVFPLRSEILLYDDNQFISGYLVRYAIGLIWAPHRITHQKLNKEKFDGYSTQRVSESK